MRDLLQIAAEPWLVAEALQRSLEGTGPALLPFDPGARASGGSIPAEVPDGVAVVLQTSGSTSAPKRVALSASALLASATATHDALGGRGQWLLALPVHYVAGLQVLTRSITARESPVVVERRATDAATLATAVTAMTAERRYAALVPAQLRAIVSAAAADRTLADTFARLDAILVGGQRLDAELAAAAARLALPVVRSYGSTETAGGCVYDGMPIGDTRVEIVDSLVQLSGPVLADGYLDHEQLSGRFTTRADRRWWVSTDRGIIEPDGRLRVLGRIDNVIVAGGIKVSLDDIEAALHGMPGLQTAIAVARPDPVWGEGFAVIADGRSRVARPSDEQIASALIAQVGRPGRPQAVVWLDSGIPLTAGGKPDRHVLSELLAAVDPESKLR